MQKRKRKTTNYHSSKPLCYNFRKASWNCSPGPPGAFYKDPGTQFQEFSKIIGVNVLKTHEKNNLISVHSCFESFWRLVRGLMSHDPQVQLISTLLLKCWGHRDQKDPQKIKERGKKRLFLVCRSFRSPEENQGLTFFVPILLSLKLYSNGK